MIRHQHGRRGRDAVQARREVLHGLAMALPLSLLLCGVVILTLDMLR
jgi:hypothetical protein